MQEDSGRLYYFGKLAEPESRTWRSQIRVRAKKIDKPRPIVPEMVVALRNAMLRPDAKDPADDGLVFLTRTGKPWVRAQPRRRGDIVALDALSQAFRKLLKQLKIN